MLTTLTIVALVLVAVISIEAWIFVARHARTSWWDNPEGRYLMRSKVNLALLFTMTLVFQVVRPRPLTAVVISVVLFAFTAYTLADLLILQTKAKREGRERNRVRDSARDARRDPPRDAARDAKHDEEA